MLSSYHSVQLTDILHVLLQICISITSDFPGCIFRVCDQPLVTVCKTLSFPSEFIKAPYKGRGINCERPLLISHPQQFSSLTILLQDRDALRLSLHQEKIFGDNCTGKTVVQAKRNTGRYSLCWQSNLLDWLFLDCPWHYASIEMSQPNHLLL